jgi:hypothetical protein
VVAEPVAGHADLAAADRRAQDGQHQLLNGWTGLRCLVLEGADKGGGGVFRSKEVPPPTRADVTAESWSPVAHRIGRLPWPRHWALAPNVRGRIGKKIGIGE